MRVKSSVEEVRDEAFRERPALHRFPGTMARRTQELAAAVVDEYGGDAARVWLEARDGPDLKARLLGLPGIGEMKAKTLAAVLGKQLGVPPPRRGAVRPAPPGLAGAGPPAGRA